MDDAFRSEMAAGYTLAEPAIVLGSPIQGDEVLPEVRVQVALSRVNRHGLIAGATGTGKTKTLQIFAGQLSALGVPVFAVLQAATLNPARYFDAESEFGTVAVGKRADLLLLDGNPMTDVKNVHRQAGILVRGQWLAKADIDARLAQIAARMSGE